ncbi:hypothetical protein LTR16_003103 [Cryomyces antarcticus]|uniref:Conserved oligomeric Golgi complex subunit 1 n=1 Tax=Cryomyces antarcticus TaxID=329879 RepID=A0ABR0M0D8_9PEZI|nr:hypothetical protein LTR16_003103 [Cryomyces antarcticus]
MATEAPDPKTLKSWEDAFQYPVPVVRRLVQQLRGNINENREKLRTLVGASYRDLLGTAERIIEMDEKMQQVEKSLAHIGRKCNSSALEKASLNYAQLDLNRTAQNKEHYVFASQLALLRSCPSVVNQILKKRSSTLLAAKVLVLARLLHKALSTSQEKPPLVDSLRNQSASLRRKLLNRIDRCLSDINADTSTLVENMCAFSLVTSSTPTDVLKHFHHVRLEGIAAHFERQSNSQQHVLQALKLCIKTLQDTQAIFPREITKSLSRLKSKPLINDPDIQGITDMNLDVHERWLANDVRDFTPWPRLDELQASETNKILKAWAKQAFNSFHQGVKTAISKEEDFKVVLHLRRELFEAWLSTSRRVPGVDRMNVLDGLRSTVNSQLLSIISARVRAVEDSASMVAGTLAYWRTGVDDASLSLWDPSSTSMDLSDGAKSFKQMILHRSNGRNDSILKVVSTFERWASSVEHIRTLINGMKESKWDDELEDDADDDLGLDSPKILLSQDDPRFMEEGLKDALAESSANMHKALEGAVSELGLPAQKGPKATFLLRVIREFQAHAPEGTNHSVQPFGLALVQPLHRTLATHVSAQPLSSFSTSLQRLFRSRYASARVLWEGNPPLPVQPSPATFKLLLKLMGAMAASGSDLWTPNAVNVLKETLQMEICGKLDDLIASTKSTSEKLVNGHWSVSEDRPNDELTERQDRVEISKGHEEAINREMSDSKTLVRREQLTQLLFDVHYLKKAFHVARGNIVDETPFTLLVHMIKDDAKVGDAEEGRLEKSATEYWKRTYLLFALLV